MRTPQIKAFGFGLLLAALAAGCGKKSGAAGQGTSGDPSSSAITLLNVSYDPTREFYEEFNAAFAKSWKTSKGQEVTIKQSHGGSGKQARAVIDGLEADVVTLALGYDVEVLAQKGLVASDWQGKLDYNAAPYTSTIVFLVRSGNPKAIKDWDDLVRTDVKVITPNPKTSGGARWNHLAAWGYALKRNNNDEAKAREFMAKFYKNVPVLDSGARGATTTFAERGIGDVLVAWENEAYLGMNTLGAGKFELISPSLSILAEPPVAVVEKYADKRGTRAVAEAYLKFLYSDQGQELAAKHYYRPANPDVMAKHAAKFSKIELFSLKELFGSWVAVQKAHFDDGGVFDQIYGEK